MTKYRWAVILPLALAVLVVSAASWSVGADSLESVVDVQKYNRSIHIMAMLLVGFGFLMVFVKKYGRSAVTATYLLVSVALPLYIAIHSLGVFGEPVDVVIDKLILAEFAAAALLICAGRRAWRGCRWNNMCCWPFFSSPATCSTNGSC